MIDAALVILCVAGLVYLVRIIIGPTLTDRIVAVDGLLVVMVAAIITAAVRSGSGLGIDVVLVVALVGFIGTAAGARFVARRGD